MTVHMIRIMAEQPPGVSVEDVRPYVDQWVSDHEQVLEIESVTLSVETYLDDRPDHFRGDWRFSLNSTKSELIDQIENILQQYVSWYIVGYHACYHDGSGGDCTWNRREEFGAVPSGVVLS